MSIHQTEAEAIADFLPKYENDGYTVKRNMVVPDLPHPYAGYEADLVLSKGDERLVVEFKQKRIGAVHKQLAELKRTIERKPKWKFKLVYLDDNTSSSWPRSQAKGDISDTLRKVQVGLKNDLAEGSFLLAWAAFEAAARRLHKRIFAKPQTPMRIVTILAEKGEIDPDDASLLRVLLEKRNALIHGALNIPLTKDEVSKLTKITHELVNKA